MPPLPTVDEPQALVDHLHEALRAAADPERAPAMEAYLKHRFRLLGVASPVRKKLQKPYLAALKARPEAVVPFAHACWAAEHRELHYVGADALRRWQRHLRPEHLADLAHFLTTHSWWDTVDSLAAHPVGHLVNVHSELVATMDAWIDSDDMWLARTALLHQLTYKDHTEPERLFRYVLRRADSKEFFLRKAQGWALRTYARIDPVTVRAFVEAHQDELSGLTKREATKHL